MAAGTKVGSGGVTISMIVLNPLSISLFHRRVGSPLTVGIMNSKMW